MPGPLVYIVGVVVVGGIAALVASSGSAGVIELGPKHGALQAKPPLAMLVYRTTDAGKVVRAAYGDVASDYKGVQALAITLDSLLAMDAEQGGLLGGNIEAAFEDGFDAMLVLLAAPGGQSRVDTFTGAVQPELDDALEAAFEWLSGDHTVAAVEGPGTTTPLAVFEVVLT